MLVDVFVLMVFVDRHLHAAHFGKDHLAEPGLHHQVNPGHGIGTEQHFVQLDSHPFDGDTAQLRCHRCDGFAHPVGNSESKLGDEPRRAKHPQRVVGEGHRGGGRGVQDSPLHRGQSAQWINKLTRPVRGNPHGHRIDGEVPANQIILKAFTKTHLRVSGNLVVAVGPKGGDLQPLPNLGHAHGSEVDAGVPGRVGPGPDNLLHRLRPGVGGEVEVGGHSAEHGVADAAPNQIQLLARGREQPAEFAQQRSLAL